MEHKNGCPEDENNDQFTPKIQICMFPNGQTSRKKQNKKSQPESATNGQSQSITTTDNNFYPIGRRVQKQTFPGIIYQIKLLMLHVKRATDKKYDFKIASEMVTADNFDDIVFFYKMNDETTACRFVQAKHAKSEITLSDLSSSSDKNRFALKKYFLSFCKIKCSKIFCGVDIQDIVICTNTNFNFYKKRKRENKKKKKNSEREKELTEGEKEPVVYKNVDNWKNYIQQINEWDDGVDIDLIRIEMAEKKYKFIRRDEIIDQIVNDTKDVFERKVSEYKNEIEKKLKKIENKKNSNGKKKKNPNGEKEMNLINEEYINIEYELNKLNEVTDNFETTIKEFFEKLVFITNFLNEKDLGTFIENELGEDYNLLDAEILYNGFQSEVINWFKKSNKNVSSYFILEDGKDLLKKIKNFRYTTMICGLCKSYVHKLKGYEISFEKNLKLLSNFLTGNDKKILHIFTSHTILTAIKVLRTLESKEFKGNHSYLNKEDGYIFINLNEIKSAEMQKIIINGFSSEKSHHLLIIDCEQKQRINICVLLEEIITKLLPYLNTKNKKVILIVDKKHQQNLMTNGMFTSILVEKFSDEEVCFSNLDSNTQNKILHKEINLQGKEVTLGSFVDNSIIEKVIDSETLLTLITDKKKVNIGNDDTFSSIGYNSNYFIERGLYIKSVKSDVLKNILKDDNLYFFFTGISRKKLANLTEISNANISYDSTKNLTSNWLMVPRPKLPVSLHKQHFEDICSRITSEQNTLRKYGFWLSFKNETFTYKKCNILQLEYEHFKEAKTIFLDRIFENVLSNESLEEQKKLIILGSESGAGKSTLMTNIAIKMREKCYEAAKPVWIERINLKDFLDVLNDINFLGHEIEKAISFVVSKKMVARDSHQLGRKIFETLLLPQKNSATCNQISCPRIVILFDGFDEIIDSICKEKTLHLIKALRNTNIIQIWVTTRPHEIQYLETELNSPVYNIYDLHVDEQRDLLSRYFKSFFKFSNDELSEDKYNKIKELLVGLESSLERFSDDDSIKSLHNNVTRINNNYYSLGYENINATEFLKDLDESLSFNSYVLMLFQEWKNSIDDFETFTQIPLNLIMLGSVLSEMKFHLPQKFTVIDLYDKLWDGMVNTYFKFYQQMNPTAHFDDALANCKECIQKLALFELNLNKSSPLRLRKFMNVGPNLERAGLFISKEGKYRFIHPSWTEYFVSKYITKTFHLKTTQKIAFEKILIETNYALTRKFLNTSFRKEIESPSACWFKSQHKNIYNADPESLQKIFNLLKKENLTVLIEVLLDDYKCNLQN